jgi:hypothetical protein
MLFIWLYIIIFSDDELDGGGILNFFPIIAVSGNTMKKKRYEYKIKHNKYENGRKKTQNLQCKKSMT